MSVREIVLWTARAFSLARRLDVQLQSRLRLVTSRFPVPLPLPPGWPELLVTLQSASTDSAGQAISILMTSILAESLGILWSGGRGKQKNKNKEQNGGDKWEIVY